MNARAVARVCCWRARSAAAPRPRSTATLGERPAILYDAPSARADRLFVASRLYPLEVLVKLDQWTKVRDVNGEVAWVENTALGDAAHRAGDRAARRRARGRRRRSRRSSSRRTSR